MYICVCMYIYVYIYSATDADAFARVWRRTVGNLIEFVWLKRAYYRLGFTGIWVKTGGTVSSSSRFIPIVPATVLTQPVCHKSNSRKYRRCRVTRITPAIVTRYIYIYTHYIYIYIHLYTYIPIYVTPTTLPRLQLPLTPVSWLDGQENKSEFEPFVEGSFVRCAAQPISAQRYTRLVSDSAPTWSFRCCFTASRF